MTPEQQKRNEEIAERICTEHGYLPQGEIFEIAKHAAIAVTESLRAELAEARAQAETDHQKGLDARFGLAETIHQQNAQILSLQAHNAKLREALGNASSVFDELDTVTWNEDGCPVAYKEPQEAANRLLASQPDNELRDRVEDLESKLLYAEADNAKLRDALNYVYYARLFPSGAKVEEYLTFEWQKRIFDLLASRPDNELRDRVREVTSEMDRQIAALFWTSADGQTQVDGSPEDAEAPERFCEAWTKFRELLSSL